MIAACLTQFQLYVEVLESFAVDNEGNNQWSRTRTSLLSALLRHNAAEPLPIKDSESLVETSHQRLKTLLSYLSSDFRYCQIHSICCILFRVLTFIFIK